MAKLNKKRTKKQEFFYFPLLKYLVILLLIGFVVFVFGRKFVLIIEDLPYFEIKEVQAPLDFAKEEERRISSFKGKSIFRINLKEVQRQLQRDYPQASYIRVMKKFPDQIIIELEKRLAFARFSVNGKNSVLDRRGYVVAKDSQDVNDLPLIMGFSYAPKDVQAGREMTSKVLKVALKIIEQFGREISLKNYHIQKIDVSNLSKINLYLTPTLNIILDQENIEKRLYLLGIILKNVQSDLGEIRYIDLRFKEPVIKKK